MDEYEADQRESVEELERRELEEHRRLLDATQWNDDRQRWYVEGKPVHAGGALEVLGFQRIDEDHVEPQWFTVRVESEDFGHVLVAYIEHHGLAFRLRLATKTAKGARVRHPLRQPR